MFFLWLFAGWVMGIFSAAMAVHLARKKTKPAVKGKKKEPVRWGDTFYVEVATGEYHFASELMKEYGRQKLCALLAEGKFVNEGHWLEKYKKAEEE